MAHFNKRHYEAIAAVVQECRKDCINRSHHAAIDNLEVELTQLFGNDNPLFDSLRFRFACKPGSNVKAKTAHLKIAS